MLELMVCYWLCILIVLICLIFIVGNDLVSVLIWFLLFYAFGYLFSGGYLLVCWCLIAWLLPC